MPLKTVEAKDVVEGKTYAEVNEDGLAVYTLEDGNEQGYDGEDLAGKLGQANQEAHRYRTALSESQNKLKPFKDIEDLEAYKTEADKALETVKNYDEKKLVDAGKVEEIKTAAVKVVEEKYDAIIKDKYEPLEAKCTDLESRLHKEMIGGRFARSKFIEEKVAVPTPLVESYFGHQFSIEDGKVTAKHSDGSPVYSKAKPGEPAEFEEALQLIVEASPFKDNILKGNGKRGGGAPGSGNDIVPGEKTMSRADAEKLGTSNPQELAKRFADGWSVVDVA